MRRVSEYLSAQPLQTHLPSLLDSYNLIDFQTIAIWDPEFKAIVEEYATDETWFAQAWKLLMYAGMF
jgi:hypothetical protein